MDPLTSIIVSTGHDVLIVKTSSISSLTRKWGAWMHCVVLDNVPICVFSIKYEDYFVIIMYTYKTNYQVGD